MSKRKKTFFKSVFVLGGTSEIAQEICLELIKRGTNKIHLVSRQTFKNDTFISELINKYKVKISTQSFDLLEEDLKSKPSISFFDLYIIAAGYLGSSTLANTNLDEAQKIARVNYYSLIPWINVGYVELMLRHAVMV